MTAEHVTEIAHSIAKKFAVSDFDYDDLVAFAVYRWFKKPNHEEIPKADVIALIHSSMKDELRWIRRNSEAKARFINGDSPSEMDLFDGFDDTSSSKLPEMSLGSDVVRTRRPIGAHAFRSA